ncbi:MAG: hypothetical protein HC893_06380 [Chloroflexaceae bacterium]|nr:hypothetical protein [Chloroflexaceae bacterium]
MTIVNGVAAGATLTELLAAARAFLVKQEQQAAAQERERQAANARALRETWEWLYQHMPAELVERAALDFVREQGRLVAIVTFHLDDLQIAPISCALEDSSDGRRLRTRRWRSDQDTYAEDGYCIYTDYRPFYGDDDQWYISSGFVTICSSLVEALARAMQAWAVYAPVKATVDQRNRQGVTPDMLYPEPEEEEEGMPSVLPSATEARLLEALRSFAQEAVNNVLVHADE